jgi:hypothetical protein
MGKSYIYKITFEEVPHFYFGVRGRSPEGDPYLGSPRTNRIYWEIYTPKKQILWVYDSWEEACEVETALIVQNWANPYCLNKNANGAFPKDMCRKGGKLGGLRTAEKLKSDSVFASERNKSVSESLKKTYSENPSLLEQKSQLLKRVAKGGNITRLEKMAEDPSYRDEIYGKVSKTKKQRLIKDSSYRNSLTERLRNATEAYSSRLRNDPQFRNKVASRLRNLARGTIWINNGSEEKRINKNLPIPSGYFKGRLKK